jgi:hypothetical protein
MPIKSDDFFLVANELREGSEPFDRSAVSRLYYGAFHQAMEFLRERHRIADFRPGPDSSTGRFEGSHQVVASRLAAVDGDAARVLTQLRRLRVTADYDLVSRWPPTLRAEAWELLNYLRGRFGTR